MADDNYDPDRLQSERPSGTPVTRVRPQREPLSRDQVEKLVRKYNPDITDAAVKGEADNVERESGGNAANKTGDGGTSGGLYQHHLGRLTGLKEFAAKEKADWTDPDIQVRYSRLEKERDYPALLKLQQTNDDRGRNEDAFKRIFERPASVLWGNDASGQPILGNDKYRFSDYAMKEHDGRKNTDMLMMTPAEYLDLSPELSPKPFENPAGRALKKSFDKGDAIESLPTLDVNVDGPTATVTDQDGRRRALLAQQNGIEAIPVAVRKTGEGEPKEIIGMNGVPMAHDFPKASDVQGRQAQQPTPEQPTEPIPLQAKPEERSLMGRVANAIIPSAAAETVNPFLNPDYHEAPAGQSAASAPGTAANPFLSSEYHEGGADQEQTPTKPVAQMSQEEVQAASQREPDPGKRDALQKEWIKSQQANFNPVAPVERALAPYAAGALAGGAMGGPLGAMAGAGAVGLTQAVTGLTGMKGPSDVTNAGLTALGVPDSGPVGRVIQQATEGAANAFTGAGAAGQLARAAAPAGTQLAGAVGSGAMNLLGRVIQSPLGKAVVNVMAEHPVAQAVSGAAGGAASQTAAEGGAPGWAQQLAGLIGALAPGGKTAVAPNMWRVKGGATQAAKEAVEAGFAIPPAEASEGHIGKMDLANMAAADAGKIKTGQMASAVNQPRVNIKVQQELGVPPGTPLTPTVLDGVIKREAQTYREVEQAIPEVSMGGDPQFRTDVAALGKRSESTEALFPSTKEPPEVPALRAEMLKHAAAPTPDVMKYMADLRFRANHNIKSGGASRDAMQVRKGLAEREAANAIEDALERSVENAPAYFRDKLAEATAKREQIFQERMNLEKGYGERDTTPLQGKVWDDANAEVQRWSDRVANANAKDQANTTLLDRFRQARKTIAQTHDIKLVTNPSSGDVSARGLARLMTNGKRPLTGNLKVIADAANNFHRAFQNPAAFGGVEPLSILDLAYAGGQMAKGAATGSIAHFLAGAMPLLRPFIREGVTSPMRQNAMIAPSRGRSAPLSAVTTPLLSTQPMGNAMAGMMGGQQ